jgi:hypothetical protein
MTVIVIASLSVGLLAMLYGLAYIGHRFGARLEPLIDIWWAYPLLGIGTFATAAALFFGAGEATGALLTWVFLGKAAW